MREPPPLADAALLACLNDHYNLSLASVRFLPIGYDPNAFVYQALSADGEAYFVKIRVGAISLPSLLVPHVLTEHGIPNILAPLRTTTGTLWCSLDRYSVMVYPFIRGENAMVAGLSEPQWRAFGTTLRAIHTGGFAARLQGQVPSETFALPSAALVRRLLTQVPNTHFDSAAATRLASFWLDNALQIEQLLVRAEALGTRLQSRPFEYVLCHADIHAANIMVGDDGCLYLIDWDGPLLAPRERDLLFIVGGKIARAVSPQEEAWFFEGYGMVDVDWTALAYYRYERAIEDIGEIGRSVFNTDMSEATKAEEVELLYDLFGTGQIVELAQEADTRGSA